MTTTIACIAARNEEKTIGKLVLALREQGLPVIVVDDCSSDTTARHAEVAGARVVSLTTRGYIAGAPIEGWQTALAMGCDYVLQIDAGGSHDPEEAWRLLQYVEGDAADVVIGSRFLHDSHYHGNRKRRIASRLAARACNLVQRHAHWRDWTSGFRLYSRRAIAQLLSHPYPARMHAFQIETLAWAGADGLRITEVPITYTAGRSSFNWKAADEAHLVWMVMPHSIGARRKP